MLAEFLVRQHLSGFSQGDCSPSRALSGRPTLLPTVDTAARSEFLHRRSTTVNAGHALDMREGAIAMIRPTADGTLDGAGASREGKITRDVVLATALEIIDRDGADGLSIRRLARALNRDPMIIYRHAPNKAALLDGVAETVLTRLKVDPADPAARPPSAGDPAPARRRPRPAHDGRFQRTRCPAHLPGPVRVPARPRPRRTARTRRQPRRDR